MARKPFEPAEVHANLSPLPENHPLVEAETEIKDTENDMAFEAAKIVGQIEASLFYETVAQKVIVETFIKLRENKAYRAIQYRTADGNVKRISDLHEFSERYFKKSYRRVQQMVDNYHLIGADLYETAEQIGFRQKDYAALKALPAEDQDVIKQAMQPESGRDQIIDLLQEMAARHASEKAALTAQAKEAEDTAEARSEVIATKERVINTLQEEAHKLRRRLETATPDEVGADLRQETAGIGWSVVGRINTDLAEAFKALDEHAQANECTHDDFMSGVLLEIDTAVLALRERYAVKAQPDGDERPEWVKNLDVPVEEQLGPDFAKKVADFNARMAAGK